MTTAARFAEELAADVVKGDPRALARAISLVDDDYPEAHDVLRAIGGAGGELRTIGVTGAPGVGKSTLIAAVVSELRAADRRVGVLTVDPTSPFSQGAMLGDRLRLVNHFLDDGVFIRSLASRGALGGLSRAVRRAARLVAAAGYGTVIVETVGVGQAEIEIARLADSVVVVLAPGLGDTVQALKAGVMEIPHIVVVNKSDQGDGAQTIRAVRTALSLRKHEAWRPPIVATNALDGSGVPKLVAALDAHARHLRDEPDAGARERRRLVDEAVALTQERLRDRFVDALAGEQELRRQLERLIADGCTPADAARELVARVWPGDPDAALPAGGQSA